MLQERRKFPRIACHLPVKLISQEDPKLIETLTKDLSIGGIRCLSPVPRPVSMPLSVELTLGLSHEPVTIPAYVSWFQSVPQSEQFYLGIAFQSQSERSTKLLSSYVSRVSSQIIPAVRQ